MATTKEINIGGKILKLETGKLAKQASGAVLASYGDTVVLCTVVGAEEPKEGQDFFPLQVEYREKVSAVGRIPGGFFKREGKPSEKEVLTSRLIDRPIRPLFPEGYMCETQIICGVYSSDQENDSDVVAAVGKPKKAAVAKEVNNELVNAVKAFCETKLNEIHHMPYKKDDLSQRTKELYTAVNESLKEKYPEMEKDISTAFSDLQYYTMT